jgi:hypothetical protein
MHDESPVPKTPPKVKIVGYGEVFGQLAMNNSDTLPS